MGSNKDNHAHSLLTLAVIYTFWGTRLPILNAPFISMCHAIMNSHYNRCLCKWWKHTTVSNQKSFPSMKPIFENNSQWKWFSYCIQVYLAKNNNLNYRMNGSFFKEIVVSFTPLPTFFNKHQYISYLMLCNTCSKCSTIKLPIKYSHCYFYNIYLLRLLQLRLFQGMILELMGHCKQRKFVLKIFT